MTVKNKLVYILPEASKKTHMKYNVEFLKSLSQDTEIFLILERGFSVKRDGTENTQSLKEYLEEVKDQTGAKYIHYTGTNIFSRIPKLKMFLLEAMFLRFKKVYIHYSFVGAFYASINPFFTTYYWNCGIPWQYERPFFQEFYESLVYKMIDNFVTGAQVLVPKYAKNYKFNESKGIVIPNWIDVSDFQNKIVATNKEELKKELNINDQKVLFFNQRLAERKGAHYIKEILKKANEVTETIIIITNDGPYKVKLIEELKSENLFDKVRYLGRVPNEKVAEILSITDIYILPSEEEGMSHSLMEAFVAKVPAVSFDVGGTKDMYQDEFKSFVLNENDIKAFSEKVCELLRNEELGKSLGESEYEKVKEYDKKKVLQEFKSKIF